MSNRKWPLGSIMSLKALIEGKWADYAAMGLDTVQVGLPYDLEVTEEATRALTEANKALPQVSMILSWSGPAVWDFIEGPATLGIVPLKYRTERVAQLKAQLDFVGACGVKLISTHAGFIPESPNDPAYAGVVNTLRELADYAAQYGIWYNLETGQETPTTLRRVIIDTGAKNIGINLDPANLMMYGKANPVDSLDVFGKYVGGVHGKDGLYPTDGNRLGKETPLGQGKVNYPLFIRRLKEVGYTGPITIEREISGDQQTKDILEGKALLERLIAEP